MKNPMDMTLLEIGVLVGWDDSMDNIFLKCKLKQDEISIYKVKEVNKLIQSKPKEKEPSLFITEKELERLG